MLPGWWGPSRLSRLELGVDVRSFDSFVGTSAGSVLASLLGAGVPVDDLLTHQRVGEIRSGPLAGYLWDYDRDTGGDRPGLPRPGLGSRELLRRNALHLRSLPPTAVLSAILPEGRGSIEAVGAMVGHVVPTGYNSSTYTTRKSGSPHYLRGWLVQVGAAPKGAAHFTVPAA